MVVRINQVNCKERTTCTNSSKCYSYSLPNLIRTTIDLHSLIQTEAFSPCLEAISRMETNIATWRARIGLFNLTDVKKRLRKKAERLSSSRHLILNRSPSSFVTLLAVLFAVTFAFVSIIALSPFREHSTTTTNSPKASSNLELIPFIFLDPATSLIPLCMDIHPNPGPSQSFYELPSIIRNTFNDLKRIQQKLARHEHRLENYSLFIRKRLVPYGLLPKTRPAFDSYNPQFHQSWKQNQQYFGRQQLKLLVSPGADLGEVKWVSFHPPFSEPPSFFLSFLILQISK